jgi:hypothetical protein
VEENAAAARIKLTAKQVEALDGLFDAGAIVGDRYPAAAMVGIEG